MVVALALCTSRSSAYCVFLFMEQVEYDRPVPKSVCIEHAVLMEGLEKLALASSAFQICKFS